MNNETINILPPKALELFLAGVNPLDIIDAVTPLPEGIGQTMDGNGIVTKPSQAGPGGRKGNTTSRAIRRKIALAEDAHQGIYDETAGTL